MQSKSKALIFLAILAFPIIAISANHQIFFGVIALIMTINSFLNISNIAKNNGFEEKDIEGEMDKELEEELEELVDIDLKQFGAGLDVVYNLISILFLFYCAFHLETYLLKGIAFFAVILQLYFVWKKTKKNSGIFDKNLHKPQILLASISNVAVILFTLINKISGMS